MTRIPTPLAAMALLVLAFPPCARADDGLPPPPPPAPVTATAAAPAAGDSLTYEQRVILAIQHMSVREIDTTLVNMRFDHWFWNAVGADAWVTWEVNDCGEQTGSPADSARDFPMCVEAMAHWDDGREALIWLAVGSIQGGVRGTPQLAYAAAGKGDRVKNFHSLAQFAKYAQTEGKAEEPARAVSPKGP